MTWIFGIGAKIVGEKLAKPFTIGALIVLIFVAGLIVAKCTGGNNAAEKQAEQTNRSGAALANAAGAAVEAIDNRAVTERDIDVATTQTQRDIGNAQDAATVRAVVVASVCGKPSHRRDPACIVR